MNPLTAVPPRTLSNVFYSTAVSGGTEVKVTDKSGNVVLSYTPTNDFTAVILSSDKLVTGETYTVSAGSNSEEITILPERIL